MLGTSTTFQLMPEFTKGFFLVAVLFFNHDGFGLNPHKR